MTSAIANIIRSRLTSLTWIERLGGLVVEAKKPDVRQGSDGQQVITGYLSYPVACETSDAACWNNGVYKHFEPDSAKAAIAFFTDTAGVSFQRVEGPNNAFLIFGFELRLLFWLNLTRLGTDITLGGCKASDLLAPYVIAQVFGQYTAAEVIAAIGDDKGGIFQAVDVRTVRELPKSPSIFAPFSFASFGDKRALFLYPYDYFGLTIGGTFVINKNCLPDFPAFTLSDEICIPETLET